MSKSIHTLVSDIYELLSTKEEGWFNDDLATSVGIDVALRLKDHFERAAREEKVGLRLSKMGPVCPRALWYSIHEPWRREEIPPWATIKYAYGHVLEALAIALAKGAGHEVTGEQDELIVDGIRGHRDCVIDGCVVDVKSCSSIQFQKYLHGTIGQSDSFGYLDQLDGYVLGSNEDPLVRDKTHGYILAIDKTLGHLKLYEHTARPESIRERIRTYKGISELNTPPRCACVTEPDGKSGNIKLGVVASYSPFRRSCFPHLRTFSYSKGRVYLTHVARLPDVPEIFQSESRNHGRASSSREETNHSHSLH